MNASIRHSLALSILLFAVAAASRAQPAVVPYSDTDAFNVPRTTTVASPLELAIVSGNASEAGVISGNGSVTKTGAGTLTLTGTHTFTGGVFVFGGALELSGGGTISNTAISGLEGGSLKVSGDGSVWSNPMDIFIGRNGAGTLTIEQGGVVNSSFALVGRPGGNGSVYVSGTASQWNNSSGIVLGLEGGSGLLEISGGTVSNLDAAIGRDTSSTGVARVSSGSWTSTELFVGGSGAGTLEISGTGSVTSDFVSVAHDAGGTGAVNLLGGTLTTGQLSEGSGNGTVTFNGGTLRLSGDQGALFAGFETGDVTLGNAGGTINTQGFAVETSYRLNGTGSLTKEGSGSLTFKTANAFTGGIQLNAGTLILRGSLAQRADAGSAIQGANGVTLRILGAPDGGTGAVTGASGNAGANTNTPLNNVGNGTNGSLAISLGDGASVLNSGAITGGAGGNGGSATINGFANGGFAGASAGAVVLGQEATLINSGAITGGNGGNGGAGQVTSTGGSGTGRAGAAGGTGATLGDHAVVTNTHILRGGNGGAGGNGSALTAPGTRTSGAGGAGASGLIVGDDSITLTNSGTIAGGHGGNAGNSASLPGSFTNIGASGGDGGHAAILGLRSILVNETDGILVGGDGGNRSFGAAQSSGGAAVFGSDITVINSGTLTGGLNGDNTQGNAITFGGTTNTLELRAGWAITGNVIAGGTTDTLTLTTDSTTTFDGSRLGDNAQFRGFETFRKTGAETLTLTGTSTYAGQTTIFAGTLQIGNGGKTGSFVGNITSSDDTALIFNRSDDSIYQGVLAGTGSLTKQGAGTLTLSGNNTYTGGTTLAGGALALGSANALGTGSTGTIFFTGGILQFSSANTADHSSRFSNADGQLYQFDTNGQDVTLGAALTSVATAVTDLGGSLTKIGLGTLTLTGANTYNGGTTISAGTLRGNTTSLQGTITIAENASLVFDQDLTDAFDGVISGTGALTKTGTGTLTFSASNTHAGGTTVSMGTLQLGDSGTVLADSGAVIVNGGTFALGTADETIGSLAGTGGIVKLSDHTLTVGDNHTSTDYQGVIQGIGGALTKTGTGTLTLSGANSFTGGIQLDAGKLIIANTLFQRTGIVIQGANHVTLEITGPTGSVIGANGTTSGGNGSDGGRPVVLGNGSTVTNLRTLQGGNGGDGLSSVTTTSFDAGHGGAGGTAVTLGQSAILTNTAGTIAGGHGGNGGFANTYLPDTIARSGNGGNGGRGAVLGDDSTGTNSAIIAGGNGGYGSAAYRSGPWAWGGTVIAGNGGDGGTALTLGARSVFTNSHILTGGQGGDAQANPYAGNLVIYIPGNAGHGGRGADLGQGSTFTNTGTGIITGGNGGSSWENPGLAGAALTGSDLTVINSGTLIGGIHGNASRADAITFGGTTNTLELHAGSVIIGNVVAGGTADALILGGMGSGTLDVSQLGDSAQFRGFESFTKNGSGTWLFTGEGTYTGILAISAGTLQIGTGTSGSYAGSIINSGALVFNRDDVSGYGGILSGEGSVTQQGAGILILSGDNTYSGTTTLAAGTLSLGSTDALGAGSTGTIFFTGGTLQFSAANTADHSGRFSNTAGQFYQIDTNGQDITLATALTSTGGSLAKTGAGTLALTGASTYSAGTTISEGALQIGDGGTTGSLAGTITVSTGGTLAFNRSNQIIHTGIISGDGVIAQQGAGTLILSGDNTYIGGTTISNGTLALGASDRLADLGAVTVSGGLFDLGAFSETVGIVTLNSGSITSTTGILTGSDYQVVSGSIDAILGGPAALTKTGDGTVTLSSDNTYSGGTIVSDGTLALGASDRLADLGAVTISGGTFDLGAFSETVGIVTLQSGSITSSSGVLIGSAYRLESGTLSATLGGSAGLTKATSSRFTLDRAQSYTGGTTINEGSLALGASERLADTGALTVSGGTFDLGAFSETVGVVTLNSGTITASTGILTGSSYQVVSGSIDAILGGSAALTKTGTGTVTLTRDNTYAGGTTVSDGTLALSDDDRLSTAGTLTVNGGIVDLLGHEQTINGLAGTGGTIRTGSLTTTQTDETTFSGNLALSQLIHSGSGSLILAGDGSNALASTVVNSGTLILAKNSASSVHAVGGNGHDTSLTINSGGTVRLAGTGDQQIHDATQVVVNTGGTLDLSGRNEAFAGLSGGGTVTNHHSAPNALSTLTLDLIEADSNFAGTLQDGSARLALTKLGGATLTLSGTNTYSGGTTVYDGTLGIAADTALGATSGKLTLIDGTLASTASFSSNRAITLDGSGGTLHADDGINLGWSGDISGPGALIKSGFGTLTLAGANTYSGGTTVSQGTLIGTTTSLQGAITTDTALIFDQITDGTFYGSISGDGSVTKTGSGSVTLSGTHTYSGGTTVSVGTLIGTTTSLQGAITTDTLLTFDQITAGTFHGSISGSGSVTKTGSGSVTLTGTHTYSGGTTVYDGTLQLGDSGNALSDTGAVIVNGGTFALGAVGETIGSLAGTGGVVELYYDSSGRELTVGGDNTSTLYSGVIQGHGGALTKIGTGTFTLEGANSYTGGTTLAAGILRLGHSQAVGTHGLLTFSGGTLQFSAANTADLSSRFSAAANQRYQLDTHGQVVILGSALTSTGGSLTKTGSGTLILTGANTYSGGTLVSEGTLQIGNEGDTGSVSGNIINNAVVSFHPFGTTTYAGDISGTGSLTKLGNHTLTLSGMSSYSGLTTVHAGILALVEESSQFITEGGLHVAAGAVFNGAGSNARVGALSGEGVIYSGSDYVGYEQFTFGAGTGTGTFAGILADGDAAGNFTKAGTGTQTLTGVNTYTGTTTVRGGTLVLDGSTISHTFSDFTIGNLSGDNGTLTIQDDGSVNNYVGYIGRNTGATGLVQVTSGTWSNRDDLHVGHTGNGTLAISGTGKVNNDDGYIGSVFGATGVVSISAGTWTNRDDLYIGFSGAGTLLVNGTGAVSNTIGYLGYNSGSSGVATVSGGTWTTEEELYVGFSGHGTLTVGDTGSVTNYSSYIGYQSTATGEATVSGGSWASAQLLFIGHEGNGTLTINGTGTVNNGYGYLGFAADSTGEATVSDGGAWTNRDELYVGYYGHGTLTLSDTASVTNTNGYIGHQSGSAGAATISGGSWTHTGDLFVGNEGDGTLNISGTGAVSNFYGYIAYASGTTGGATVSGGTWTNRDELYVGYSGSGTLTISGTGAVDNTYGYLGYSSDSTGEATVSGGSWTNSDRLYIGYEGGGTLTLSGNGTVTNTTGYLGYESTATGTVTVSGGSWHNSEELYIGYRGTGTLEISGTGTVTSVGAYIGYNASSSGSVSVTGGTWTNSDDLTIGENGTGTLDISAGTVTNAGSEIGANAGSTGTVTVTGGTWTHSDSIFVGRSGDGTLEISGTGTVTSYSSYLGSNAGGTGLVQISGGSWTNEDELLVGYSGDGTMEITGGHVTALYAGVAVDVESTGTIRLNGGTFTTGQVYKGNGSGSFTFSGGTLQLSEHQAELFSGFGEGEVTLGAAGGTIDTQAFTVEIAVDFSGNGSLTKTGAGTLTLSGANSYTGGTTIAEGTLQVGHASALGTGPLILAGGTLDLNGFTLTFADPLTVTDASAIDFSSGVTLRFGDSSAVDWTGTLTLLNFDPEAAALFFGADELGLTEAQLNLIEVEGYTITGLSATGQLTFEAAAVPEPATAGFLLGLFSLALAATVLTRRRSK